MKEPKVAPHPRSKEPKTPRPPKAPKHYTFGSSTSTRVHALAGALEAKKIPIKIQARMSHVFSRFCTHVALCEGNMPVGRASFRYLALLKEATDDAISQMIVRRDTKEATSDEDKAINWCVRLFKRVVNERYNEALDIQRQAIA